MSEQFEITEEKEQPVLSVRKRTAVGNLPAEIGNAYKAVYEYLGEIGQQPAGAPFVAYYNMEMEDLDVEMGFPVAEPVAGKGDILAGKIPDGKQASCVYHGAYTNMGPTYEALTSWIKEKGEVPSGVYYEIYYNSPMEVPESELMTKLVFLLK